MVGSMGEAHQHTALALEHFVRQLDDEAIRYDDRAKRPDMQQVQDFRSRLGMLAENGVGRSG